MMASQGDGVLIRQPLRGLAAMSALLLAGSAAFGQAAGEAPATGPVGAGMRPALEGPTGLLYLDLFWTSPVIISIILLLSILAVMMFLFFMLTITRGGMVPADFVDNVTRLVIGGQYKEAADFCRGNRGTFVASIVQRCVENAGKEHSVILDMADSEGQRRAEIVWNRLSYLSDIANVAPMLGLLGTVVGMIQAFFGLPTEQGTINSEVLSRAIGGAMATTMIGLVVGILALVFYSLAKARATRVLADAEQAVHSIADHIKREAPAAPAAGRRKFVPADEGDL